MKSQKAKEAIERYRQAFSAPYQADETAEYCRLFKEISELAEQDAAERMRENAIEAFCAANCPKGCSFGADGNIGCGAKAIFIQKLNEE